MFSIYDLAQFIEDTLNAQLPTSEQVTSPFRIYTDVGDATKAYRDGNKVYKKRFGVCTVSSSNTTPLGSLEVYNAMATVEILVNIDAMEYTGDIGEYTPVRETRNILDTVASTLSAQPSNVVINGVTYSVVPVYTLSNTGAFSVVASELGKVVPLSFNVALNVVETGINSANVVITINGQRVYASQIAEDMVTSAEGQTRSGASKSTFNIQEARYSISFVTPLTTSTLSRIFLNAMHNGADDTVYSINIRYLDDDTRYLFIHRMQISGVRLTAAIPNNAGLNVELIEADEPMEDSTS